MNSISPYYLTPVTNYYLDILVMPQLDTSLDDEYYTIEKKYEYRPDILAKKLYGSEYYWFVFILRNMDVIQDPIFDFKAGTEIRLPTIDNVKKLG